MAQGDLTSLANVKDWLGLGTASSPSDSRLSRLISALSGSIRSEIQRFNLLPTQYTDVRDGSGNDNLVLNNWPVTSVSLVKVGSAIIPPGVTTSDGVRSSGWYAARSS